MAQEKSFELDVSLVNQSGLYEIKNMHTGKRYIGQSQNVLERLGKHVSMLNDGKHDCVLLQKDWNQAMPKEEKHIIFRFIALSVGSRWAEKNKREEEERRLIKESDPELLYNQLFNRRYINSEFQSRSTSRICFSAYGTIYSSMAEGVKALGISRTEIQRRIRLETNTDFILVERVIHGYTPVLIEGTEYPSVNSVVQAGLAKNRHQVLRRLSSLLLKWAGWVYKNGKKNEKKKDGTSNDYPERE